MPDRDADARVHATDQEGGRTERGLADGLALCRSGASITAGVPGLHWGHLRFDAKGVESVPSPGVHLVSDAALRRYHDPGLPIPTGFRIP